MADDIHRRRDKTTDDQVFLTIAALHASQCELVIFQSRSKAELAITEVVKKPGDAAVKRPCVISRAEDGNFIQRFDADALAKACLLHAVQVRSELRRLLIGKHQIANGSFQHARDTAKSKGFRRLFALESMEGLVQLDRWDRRR